ncbi:predicted protein [Streptomyces sp. SPB78]|nr:predicted protein [Streptomyces sp. SPB78]
MGATDEVDPARRRVGLHAAGGQDRRARVGARGRDDEGASGERVGAPVQGREVGPVDRSGDGAYGAAAAQPAEVGAQFPARFAQLGRLLGGGEGAQRVGEREQRREMPGELDVQLLLTRVTGETGLLAGGGMDGFGADRLVHEGPPGLPESILPWNPSNLESVQRRSS